MCDALRCFNNMFENRSSDLYLVWIICSVLFVIVDKQNVYRYLLLRVLSDQIALSVFGVYVLMDERNVLDAQKIFVSVALINILKTPLSQLPFAMSTTMQASEKPLFNGLMIYFTQIRKKQNLSHLS